MGAWHRIELWAVRTNICGLDLIKMNSYFCSNLDHSSKIQWSKPLLPYSVNENKGGGGVAPWLVVRELGYDLRCPSLRCDPSYATYMAQGIHFTPLWWRDWSKKGWRCRCGSGRL
jgi:hypothetical protein